MTDNLFTTVFAKTLLKPFRRAVDEFGLLNNGDRVGVCVSGGKDSMAMAALFSEYKKHSPTDFELKFIFMNAGLSDESARRVNENARRLLGETVELDEFKTEIFKHAAREKNPCSLCSKMRRGRLYKRAEELGCNKIALGHNFDDVIESVLMGVLYGGQTGTMLPKVRAQHFPGMELIRPLFYVREADIIEWSRAMKMEFSRLECPLGERGELSKRESVKRLIAALREEDPQVEQNIFRAVCNVRLDRLMSFKDGRGVHTFLENYDEKN